MAGYKLATYQSADGPRAGLVIDDNVFDAAKLTGKAAYSTVLSIITDWSAAKARAQGGGRQGRQEPGQGPAARQDQAPRARCCGRIRSTAPVSNYADHAAEMARR